MMRRHLPFLLFAALIAGSPAWAGPPFRTDDPEPVDYHHGEVLGFSTATHVQGDTNGILPGVEANYGILPNTQIHLIAPMAFDKTAGESRHYGYGDTEIGVKYRILDQSETGWWPSIGVFPLVELPTGSEHRNLGAGHTREFLPVWLQKDFGAWTTYGGGGYWNNPGADNKNYWFFGWLLQRKITDQLTLGAELFHQTADKVDGRASTGFNVGGIYDFTETYHLLFSAGRGIQNTRDTNEFSYYLAFQWTF